MEELNGNLRPHRVTLTNRKNCSLGGVKDVLSFDMGEVLLETEQGMLAIKGEELHVSRLTLDKGEVDVEGRIDSFTYTDAGPQARSGESFFSKLFR